MGVCVLHGWATTCTSVAVHRGSYYLPPLAPDAELSLASLAKSLQSGRALSGRMNGQPTCAEHGRVPRPCPPRPAPWHGVDRLGYRRSLTAQSARAADTGSAALVEAKQPIGFVQSDANTPGGTYATPLILTQPKRPGGAQVDAVAVAIDRHRGRNGADRIDPSRRPPVA
jgi:hypothetical protein